MRVIVAADDNSVKASLMEALKRTRACTGLHEAELDGIVDTVIRIQPDMTILGLRDTCHAEYHALVREIREIAVGRIVVVGPTADAKSVLKFLQDGAFQFIDEADFHTDGKLVPNDRAVITVMAWSHCRPVHTVADS